MNFVSLRRGPRLSQLRFGDFDGDGKTDVFTAVASGDGTHRWRFSSAGTEEFQDLRSGELGLRDLTFATRDVSHPNGARIVGHFDQDFDGDGKTDVFATREVGDGVVWMMSRGGTERFSDLNDVVKPSTWILADFDGNGMTDVFSWLPGDFTVQYVFWRDGRGRMERLGAGRVPVGLGDFDADGKADIFTMGRQIDDETGEWLLSSGGINPETVFGKGPSTMRAFGDFDGDGRMDVFASRELPDGTHRWGYHPGGAERFVDLAIGPAPGRGFENLGFGDFDGDGKTDVFAQDCR